MTKTDLYRLLAWIRDHDVYALVRGDAIIVYTQVLRPDGVMDEESHTVRTMSQAREVLGY